MADSKEIFTELERVKFSSNSQAIYDVTKQAIEPDSLYPYANYGAWPWAIWGTDNNYPQRWINQNMEDPTSAPSIKFKRNAHYGKGFYFYEESVDADGNEIKKPIAKSKLPQEIQDFLFLNDIENFQQGIINDFEWFNMYYVQYILSRQGKVIQVKHVRTKDVRAHKRNPQTGLVPSYFLSAYWPLPLMGFWAEVPAFDPYNIDVVNIPNGIYRHALLSVDRDYYVTPEWHSNMRWLEISRRIPKWILSLINNSANIKYHIKIPQQYFELLHPRERYNTDNDWKAAMKKEYDTLTGNIDNMLSGEEHVAKAFYSRVQYDENMKAVPGWEITLITNNIKDDAQALLPTFQTASAAICNAHNVPVSLSGTIVPGDTRAGSGSDVREQFNLYMQTATVQPRQTTTEWFEFVKRINKWDDLMKKNGYDHICMGYRDIVFQSIDQNPTGYQVTNEPKPTSVNKQ